MNEATELFHEQWDAVAQLGAQSQSTNQLSAAIDMKDVTRLVAIINIGVITATGTFDAKLTQAVTSGGTYKDITGKAITQLLAASDSNPAKPIVIELRADEMDLANGYRYVKVSLTPATAASLFSLNVFAAKHYRPAAIAGYKQAIN